MILRYPRGYFNGACQGSEGSCGNGMCHFMSENHIFNFILGGGLGTNTRAEFITLWCLLHFASPKGVLHLLVLGDSKIIIDWVVGRQV